MRPVLIAGPTASGKSALALAIAERDNGCVINADALQVYACWRVLTARPDDAAPPRAARRSNDQRRRRVFLRLVLGLGRPLSEAASASWSPSPVACFPGFFCLRASAMRLFLLRSTSA